MWSSQVRSPDNEVRDILQLRVFLPNRKPKSRRRRPKLRQEGRYLQGAFDMLSLKAGARAALFPFVRYEKYDTQAKVPAGYEHNPENDASLLTVGFGFKPIEQLIVKTDWQRRRNAARTGVKLHPCIRVTGTEVLKRNEKDGDIHIQLKLDKQFLPLLNATNKTRQETWF